MNKLKWKIEIIKCFSLKNHLVIDLEFCAAEFYQIFEDEITLILGKLCQKSNEREFFQFHPLRPSLCRYQKPDKVHNNKT